MQSQTVIHILLLISSLISALTAVLILAADFKSWLNRFLAIILGLGAIWILSIYFGIMTGSLFIANFSFFSTGFILLMGNFLMLAVANRLNFKNILFYAIPAVAISIISIIGGAVVRQISIAQGYLKITEVGPFYYPFFFFIIIYLILFLINARKASINANEPLKTQIKYIIYGFFISSILGLIFNFFLPMLGFYQFNTIGPIFVLFMGGMAGLAATKHYLYDFQVVLAEFWAILLILIGVIWLILNLALFNLILFLLLTSICILFIRTNLSEAQKKLQLEKDKEALQKLDELKDEFLQMTEHELNTPIGVIEGKLSMILEENFGGFTQKQKEYLKPVFTDARRLAKLSKELMEVSEIDEGSVYILKEEFYFIDLAAEIIAKIRPQAVEKSLTIETDIDDKIPKILADRNKIGRVLNILIENAIKFTSHGLVKIEARLEDKQLFVAVADSGVGVKREDQENIFGKFYQADRFSEIPMEQQGTGVSLYIAKNLITLQRGRLWLESTPGLGSKFSFTLPLR